MDEWMNKAFGENDILSKELLERKIIEETNSIYKSEVARKGRTREQVEATVKRGMIPVVYLMENAGYSSARHSSIYHDLYREDDGITEIKTLGIDIVNVNMDIIEETSYLYREANEKAETDVYRIRCSEFNMSETYILFLFDTLTNYYYKFFGKRICR